MMERLPRIQLCAHQELIEDRPLLRLLDGDTEPEISFHIDREPDWAGGRRYVRIVGIALSDWTQENGGLIVDADGGPESLELAAGDAVMMSPDLPHSGGVDRPGAIRYGVYFRYLQDA